MPQAPQANIDVLEANYVVGTNSIIEAHSFFNYSLVEKLFLKCTIRDSTILKYLRSM